MALALSIALAAAALFYLASPHQTLRPPWAPRPAPLRWIALLLLAAAAGFAERSVGLWPAIFTVLCALMLGCVALPLLGLWRGRGQGQRHVG